MLIHHNPQKERFYIIIHDKECFLEYEKKDDNLLDLKLTYVPIELRNLGIGSAIVQYALKYAEKHGFKVLPTCIFVEDFLKKHDEFKNIVYYALT